MQARHRRKTTPLSLIRVSWSIIASLLSLPLIIRVEHSIVEKRMTNDIWFTALMSRFFKSRRLKAFVASGFLILFGLALLSLFHWLDDSRAATFTNSLSTEVLKPRARVFDVILLNDELDSLEIRLNELHSVVDVFFIMEAEYTFSGEAKPLYFHNHETQFRQFRDKIVHIIIPHLSPEEKAQYEKHGGWANERFARNKGFKIATDTRKPNDGDWIVLSDLDEFPRRSFLEAVKTPDPDTDIGRRLLEGYPEFGGDVIKLACRFYYYSYEYRHRGDWTGPKLLRYRDSDSPIFTRPELDPYPGLSKIQHVMEDDWSHAGQRLRDLGDIPTFDDQCHHCTWCFSNITQVIRKMRSYSHQEHNAERYRNRNWILDHFSQGIDLFEREGEIYDFIEDNQDLPQYVRDSPKKFSFMLRRKGLANAGFIDVDPLNPLSE